MDWSKALELMQLYVVEHPELSGDDVTAHLLSISALMCVVAGSQRLGVQGVIRFLFGRDMAISIIGGDSIGVDLTKTINLKAELAQMNKEVECAPSRMEHMELQ